MAQVIPKGSAGGVSTRIPFTLLTTDKTAFVNLGGGADGAAVTGVKCPLSWNGAVAVNSANDIVKVNGAAGEYYIELSTGALATAAVGVVRGIIQPAGCAVTKFTAQIGPADSLTEGSTDLATGTALAAVSSKIGTPTTTVAGDIAAIQAGSGLDAAGVRAAVGLASANLDTALTGISAKTDQLTFTTGKVHSQVKGMDANILNAAALATDAAQEVAVAVAAEVAEGINVTVGGQPPAPVIVRTDS